MLPWCRFGVYRLIRKWESASSAYVTELEYLRVLVLLVQHIIAMYDG